MGGVGEKRGEKWKDQDENTKSSRFLPACVIMSPVPSISDLVLILYFSITLGIMILIKLYYYSFLFFYFRFCFISEAADFLLNIESPQSRRRSFLRCSVISEKSAITR